MSGWGKAANGPEATTSSSGTGGGALMCGPDEAAPPINQSIGPTGPGGPIDHAAASQAFGHLADDVPVHDPEFQPIHLGKPAPASAPAPKPKPKGAKQPVKPQAAPLHPQVAGPEASPEDRRKATMMALPDDMREQLKDKSEAEIKAHLNNEAYKQMAGDLAGPTEHMNDAQRRIYLNKVAEGQMSPAQLAAQRAAAMRSNMSAKDQAVVDKAISPVAAGAKKMAAELKKK